MNMSRKCAIFERDIVGSKLACSRSKITCSMSVPAKRRCRFWLSVEASGTLSVRLKSRNHRYVTFTWISRISWRSERTPNR